jgi:hypothetical protein
MSAQLPLDEDQPMSLLAIDPGREETAFVVWNGAEVADFGKRPNDEVLAYVRERAKFRREGRAMHCRHLAIEMVASYGMPVGREVFETCVYIGRLIEAWGGEYSQLYRKTVVTRLCGTVKASDANVRQALLDHFGGKLKAIGNVKKPGPLYGITGDVWSALAVAFAHSKTAEELQT